MTPRAVHYYSHGANGTFKILSPMVLGHESCGIITALGPNIPKTVNLKVRTPFLAAHTLCS
jgi:L-iditol 2-dehydrogenase